ncbi:DUF2339 domain-containing protein [Bacteroides sp. UBA939]|uniref:DUF2339 domain-containing protein n=1 Tax=Bacteroides sp. UBA939 TaxID=1946092 RepID=UPI0025BBA23E|nr:DUF2339 domain-containing protein [Bacteroides sp. UBA939]
MEVLLVILIIVAWINLHSHISRVKTHIDSLQKDLHDFRKEIEAQLEALKKQQAKVSQAGANPVEEVREQVVRTTIEKPIEEPVETTENVSVAVDREEDSPVRIVETVVDGKPEKQVATAKPEEKIILQPVVKPSAFTNKKRKVDYEKYIGENLFGKIGILVLVVGMGLFVKYAIDKNWINEVFRTVLGFVVGSGLLLLSQRLKGTYRTFSSLLAGGAFAIFYVTVSMAYHYYGLFSQTAAFIILVVLTVFMSLLAVFYNHRELAVIALVGGFISPFLVSNGAGNYLVLFTYLTILNMGMFGLSIYKKWGELPIICFTATYLIMLGYSLVTDLDSAQSGQLVNLLLFATLFFLIFLLPIIIIVRTKGGKINQLLLIVVVLNNFLYLLFALWYLREWQLAYNIKGAFTLFIALVNVLIAFIVRKRKADKGLLFTLLNGMFLTFASLSVPVQLDGTFITLLWATEVVVLLWLFIRFRQPVYVRFIQALLWLTVLSFLMDITNAMVDNTARSLLLNGTFTTGIFTGVAFGVFAWLMERRKALFTATSKMPYVPFNAIAWLAGCGIIYLSFIVDFYLNIDDSSLMNAVCLAFTCLTLLLLLVGLRKRFGIDTYKTIYAISVGLSLCLFVRLSWLSNGYGGSVLLMLQWATLAVVIIHLFLLAACYYRSFDFRQKSSNLMTSFVGVASTILFAVAVNNMLHLLGWEEELSAALSISLGIAGFVQMSLGMRLHLKILRMISLAVFGVVLLKLVIVDLWLLPTVGKIIVFILLGVMLLVLSFLYQKLKKVLFADSHSDN